MANALRFRQWKTPKQPGERARLKIVHGPDLGSVFVVTSEKFSIGRGDENDVILSDLRASRRHVEMELLASGHWRVRDLGSQNGVIWNGMVTREASVNSGDILTIGETAFEFLTDGAGTKVLHAPSKKLPPTYLMGGVKPPASESKAVAKPVVRQQTPASLPGLAAPAAAAPLAGLQGMGDVAGLGAAMGGGAADSSEKRKKILIGVVAVLGIWTLMDESSPKKTPTKAEKAAIAKKEKERKEERDLASYLPPLVMGTAQGDSEAFFQEGFREFREGNFLRARIQFETAIQINPAHGMARNYLKQSTRAIDDAVKKHIERGRRDLDAGKLRSARAHFEAVQRLLNRDTENPSWIEANDQLRTIHAILGRGRADR